MKLVIGDGKSIDADQIVTGRTCVIGQSGSGKSYTVAVLCEELAKNNIGFCIIDTEGEYFSLKEKYPILWVGSDPNSDIEIEDVNYKDLANKIINKGIPTIFDVSEISNAKQAVKKILKEIYTAETKAKKPFLIIIEEVDKFAPQRGDVLPEIEEISRRGRKRGLGLLVATQRPALVNKNILSQCANQIIGKLTINHDLNAVKLFFPDRTQLDKLPTTKPGCFFIQGGIMPDGKMITIRRRETHHKAITPRLMQRNAIQSDELKTIEVELEKDIEVPTELEEVKKEYIAPQSSKEEIFNKIKKHTKEFILFGKEATVADLHLKLFPIYENKIRYFKKGVIKEKFFEFYTYIDAIKGDIISISKGMKLKAETSIITCLKENEIKVLKYILKENLSATEISFKTGYSESSVRKIIKTLLKNRLITSKKNGRSTIYSGFIKFKMPELKDLKDKKAELTNKPIQAEIVKPKITTNKVKAIIKGIEENSDIIENKIIYYPFYEAIIIKKNSKSKVYVDAITKKIIS